jgi:signal transduction histidine kinase
MTHRDLPTTTDERRQMNAARMNAARMNAAGGEADRVAVMDDAQQAPGHDADALRQPAIRQPANGRADIANDALCAMTEDHNRIAHDVNDTLVHRMFVVSLGLHAALSSIERDTDHQYAAEKIRHAITGLDQAVSELRNAVVGLTTSATAPAVASDHDGIALLGPARH